MSVDHQIVDVHAWGEVAGIDGDVRLASLADGNALHLLAAHVIDEDIGSLSLFRNIERDHRALAERVGLVLVHPHNVYLVGCFLNGTCFFFPFGLSNRFM